MSKQLQKKYIESKLRYMRLSIGPIVEKIEIVDMGLTGLVIQVTLDHMAGLVTLSIPILPNFTNQDIDSEIQGLIDMVNDPNKLEALIKQSTEIAEITGVDTVIANAQEDVNLMDSIKRFFEKGISFDEMMRLVAMAQTNQRILNRLNAFLEQGVNDDFSDVLGKKPKSKK